MLKVYHEPEGVATGFYNYSGNRPTKLCPKPTSNLCFTDGKNTDNFIYFHPCFLVSVSQNLVSSVKNFWQRFIQPKMA